MLGVTLGLRRPVRLVLAATACVLDLLLILRRFRVVCGSRSGLTSCISFDVCLRLPHILNQTE